MKKSSKSLRFLLKKLNKRRKEKARSTKIARMKWRMKALAKRGRPPEINRWLQLKTRSMRSGSRKRWAARKTRKRASEFIIN